MFRLLKRSAPSLRFRQGVRWRALLVAFGYLAALGLVPLLAGGANLALRQDAYRRISGPAAFAPLPAPPLHDPSRKVAVVLSSAYGVEMTDFLPPFEILARSGAFDVYAVAPERTVLPIVNSMMFQTTLDFIPHFSFAGYDAAIGRAPDLIVIPWVPDHTPERDASLIDWIRAHAGPETTVMSICAGSQILAETGLLDGHTATTHTQWFARLEPRFRNTTWVRNVRWVDDGPVITSANLATGIDATLHAVDRLVDRSAAEDVARQLGYRYTRYLDDPHFTPPTGFIAPIGLNAAYRWGSADLGVLLYDGVSEMALAGLLDPATSTAVVRTHVVAPARTVVWSRNGLAFVPRDDFQTAPRVDRMALPGGDPTEAAQRAVEAWTQRHPAQPVVQLHRNVGRGESAYDATLQDLSRTTSRMVAVAAGQAQFYPVDALGLTGAGGAVAPVAIPAALATLGVALVYALSRVRLRPQPRSA